MQNCIPAASDTTIIATAPEWGYALHLPVIAWQSWIRRDNSRYLLPVTPLGLGQEFQYALAYRGGYCAENGVSYPTLDERLAAATPNGQPRLSLHNYVTPPVARSVATPTDEPAAEVHDGD